jgi:hypothetical protein
MPCNDRIAQQFLKKSNVFRSICIDASRFINFHLGAAFYAFAAGFLSNKAAPAMSISTTTTIPPTTIKFNSLDLI